MTPHIKAKKNQIAKLVLMSGDPLRARHIAQKYLDPGFKRVNGIRNMYMYTGTYKGKQVTIAGSGMGCPSIGIYSYELFAFYDVDTIVRIGSAGSYWDKLDIHDIVLATEAYADSSSFRRLVVEDDSLLALPSEKTNNIIRDIAKKTDTKIHEGRVHSSDVFYSSVPLEQRIENSGAICVEMESYALFTNAEKLGKNAACLLTISDNLIEHKLLSPQEREKSFEKMVKLALEISQH